MEAMTAMTKEPTKPPGLDSLMGQMRGPAPTSDAIKRVTAGARPAGLTTQRRPLTVSIVSWILIVSSGWSLLFLPFSLNNPTTRQVFQATEAAPVAVILLNVLGGLANIAAGLAMLKRRRWGRQLYVTATPAIILIGMLLYHFRLLPFFLVGFVLYVVFLVLLTRRAASDYFSGSVGVPSATEEVTPRSGAPASGIRKRFASILLLVLGAWTLAAWLMMIVPLSVNRPALAIGSLMFAVVSAVFVVSGVLLWGRRRWAVLLGTLLVSVGGLLLVTSGALLLFTSMRELRDQFAGVDPAMMEQMVRGSAMFGIGAVVAGALSIVGQRRLDGSAQAASPGSARWASVAIGVLVAGVLAAPAVFLDRLQSPPSRSGAAPGAESPGPQPLAPPPDEPPASRSMVGGPGVDAYGYPLATADKRGLVSLLRHRRYADLAGYVEAVQADFEADFRKEYWPIDAIDAFNTADPSLEPLLEEWAKQTPGSFAPHAARGTYFVAVGWSRRGTRWAAETSQSQFAEMQRYHTRAWADLQRALGLRPKLVAAYRKLIGLAMAATSDPALGRELLDRALEACPNCFQVRVTHMVSLQPRWGGSHAAMLAFAREAARLADANPKLTVLKGYVDLDRCTTEQEGLDGRRAACARALEAGEHWEFLQVHGELLLEMKEPARALADLSRAVALRPQQAPTLASQAAALTRLGRLEEARTGLMAALAIDPTDDTAQATRQSLAHAFLMQGYAAYTANRGAEAVASYDTAAGLDPANAEVFFWRGAAHVRNRDVDRAIADFKAAIERNPRHFESHRQLDYVLARRGRFDEVVALWTRFIALNPNEPRAHLERGGAYFHQGRKDLALEDAETACRMGLAEGCQRAAQMRGAR